MPPLDDEGDTDAGGDGQHITSQHITSEDKLSSIPDDGPANQSLCGMPDDATTDLEEQTLEATAKDPGKGSSAARASFVQP